jgi:predicted transcriptional regulator
MTTTMTIRLPAKLAAQFKAKARHANTSPTEILRQAASKYVREDKVSRSAMVAHLRSRAGTWDGDVSGKELLKMTRP